MLTEFDKASSSLLQIVGFSLMAPLGKLYLSFLDLSFDDINLKLLIYFLISLILGIIGIMIVLKGLAILYEGN